MESYDPATIADAFPIDAWKAARLCGPNGGNCVEVNTRARGLVGLRDSKPTAGPLLAFDDQEWGTFLTAAKLGRFDRA